MYLTIFSIPKPFRGHIGVIQRNAIRSWTLLRPECEVILFGKDEGVAETAREFGARHVPDVAQSEYGTPLVSDVFRKASEYAAGEFLCYANTDIIMMGDFIEAIKKVSEDKKEFLMTGRHWKLDISEPLGFSGAWEERIEAMRRAAPKRGDFDAMDFFAFPRRVSFDMPAFAVGRPGWDNWLVYRARAMRIPVIDASDAVKVIHQNHDYSHVPKGNGASFNGPEAAVNRRNAAGFDDFGVRDATHELTAKGLRPALDATRLARHLASIPKLYPHLAPLFYLPNVLIKITRPARMRWRRKE